MSKEIPLFALVSLFLIFCIAPNFLDFTVLAISEGSEKPLVFILVNSTIYDAIKPSLNQYAIDVENSGFSVNITETDWLSDKTPEGIRSCLQAMLPRLVGCLLVGDIPAAWYECEQMGVAYTKFPIDFYYMDLNGVWTDLDNDTVYDRHSGDVAPEIWVGRLKVPKIDNEISLLKNYFDKNHRYRNGLLTLPWWRALLYVDDSASLPHSGSFTSAEIDAERSLSRIYTDISFVRDRETTNAEDYKRRLEDSLGFQWVCLMCHGTYSNHTFMVPKVSEETWFEWDGTVNCSDYQSIDPRVFFYHFVVCSAARYTESDYLVGSAVFTGSYGLLGIGSSEMISTIPPSIFYESLANGNYIGGAFREWLVNLSEEYNYPQLRFYGLTLIGDPTLRCYHELHDIAVTNVMLSQDNQTGAETLSVTVTVENQGDFTEDFNITVYYDSSTIFNYTRLTLASGAKRNVTFVSKEPRRFVIGNHTRHVMKAEASNLLGELDRADNTWQLIFYGTVESRVSLVPLSPIFFAISINLIFGALGIFFLKALTYGRIPFLRRLKKMMRRED